MSHEQLAALTAAATAYQDFYVPALFGEWGPRLATVTRVGPGMAVLDVACGTGVLARAAAAAGADATGVDLNPGMLAVARQLSAAVDWREAAAESLPFPDHTFDAVVSQFGLMFFPDPVAALREMWRVLRPGGRMVIAVWAELHQTPAYAAEVDLLERGAGREAADALRAPFGLGDREQLRQLFADAGIGDCRIETMVGQARFPGIRAMVETDLRGWLPVMGVELPEPTIQTLLEQAEVEFRRFLAADGSAIEFPAPAHVVQAMKPA